MDLKSILASKDAKALAEFARANNLVLSEGKLVPRDDEAKAKAKYFVGFWDQRQQARKILLNSLYGALLNEALRFSDERMGQSVTLTGRRIARHMGAKINEIIEGEYDHLGKSIVYQDTDSAYFTMAHHLNEDQLKDRDMILDIYKQVADATNESFPDFMNRTFNTGMKRGEVIAAGIELIASKALFIKKKKYACLKFWDDDNGRLDTGNQPGKLKAMGLDLKRADTPKFMQTFLESILMDVLQDASENDILNQIKDFRVTFKSRPAWEKGSPKKVSNLTKYNNVRKRALEVKFYDKSLAKKERSGMPGHVLASINWNTLLDVFGDRYSMRITDGSRIIVCKLKPNHTGMTSVAYPVDEPHLPQWFRDLPFDDSAMEDTIIDKKISNLLGVLKWKLKLTRHSTADAFIKW